MESSNPSCLYFTLLLYPSERHGLVWWHINHCRLFKAKSSFYIYMIWFGWVLWHINHCRLFNAKSFLYIYIKYMKRISSGSFKILSTKCSEIIYIKYMISEHFFCTQLNGFTYFYLIWIILFTINHLFAHSLMFPSIAMYHQQFIETSVICLLTVRWANGSSSNYSV